MGFPLVDISPPTEILPVHLPGSNYMNTDNLNNIKNAEEIEILDEQIQKKKTTKLTAFFDLNKKRLDGLHKNTFDEDLYYNEVSKYYVWHNESQSWEKRERFFKSDITLNRLNLVPI